jgi:hypothetical protein
MDHDAFPHKVDCPDLTAAMKLVNGADYCSSGDHKLFGAWKAPRCAASVTHGRGFVL